MKITELMTHDVATCRTSDSLNRAAQLMWERRCGCVPVLDDNDRVVGMLTDRDLGMAAYTQGRRLDDVGVTAAMSRPVQTCLPSASVEEAEDLMMAHGIHRLVVVDPEGELRGLVSLNDIARCAARWDGAGEIDLEKVALTLGEIARRNGPTWEESPDDGGSATDVREFVENSLEALKTLRDEIRVDINLASKEVRDRWRRLESLLRAAETRARSTRLEGSANLAGLIENARQFRTRVREQSMAAAPPGRKTVEAKTAR
ncbi:MAG TPA: CBS domain-containing protein [Polyangia bacterium]|nr:CBS domain-containing protein [Polyangia bacterium]